MQRVVDAVLRAVRPPLMLAWALVAPMVAIAGDAPAWMQALVSAPLPPHDEQATAVLLYEETVLTVKANGKIRRLERKAFKILRSEGEDWGRLQVNFDERSRITSLYGWSIPVAGKAFQVKERDAVETALPGIQNGELMSDVRAKILIVPAATPGSIVGYEYEQEQQPYFLEDVWDFQETVPLAEAHYTLQLPQGWSYKATWINHAEVDPGVTADGVVRWTITGAEAVRLEKAMPPWRGVAARMVVALIPPGGKGQGLSSWSDIGRWEAELTRDRHEASPAIRQKIAELTAPETTAVGKMRALARFVQLDIRYVAIELGIGGYQPHAAAEVFEHRYGDCKDKANLLSTMLREIGIESKLLLINTVRGTVTDSTPANLGFNHAILAIQLPADVADKSLSATAMVPSIGRILYFDPTDSLIPFGNLRGPLQGNFGLMVASEGGVLVALPQLPPESSSMQRTARMTVDDSGTLRGDVTEVSLGDVAAQQRASVKSAGSASDRIGPVEALAAKSLANFQIQKASIVNLAQTEKPFEWHYSLEVAGFAKVSDDLMFVRPRVLGEWSSEILETKEMRRHPVEFDGLRFLSDSVDIALPPGYLVDELPPPANIEYPFADYHSRTEGSPHQVRLSRTLRFKQLSVPQFQAEDLKKFYRAIAADERRVVVLKRIGKLQDSAAQ